jgi:hypothetical protein
MKAMKFKHLLELEFGITELHLSRIKQNLIAVSKIKSPTHLKTNSSRAKLRLVVYNREKPIWIRGLYKYYQSECFQTKSFFSVDLILLMVDWMKLNKGFTSSTGPRIFNLFPPCNVIIAVLKIVPFSEYSIPYKVSRRSLTTSHDLRSRPLSAYKTILLSVISTWYFLCVQCSLVLVLKAIFSKGSKMSCTAKVYLKSLLLNGYL